MFKLKEAMVAWYIRNVVGPNVVHYESPGFIVTDMTTPYGRTYQRDILLSEDMLATIEKTIVKKFGNIGRQALYSAGKQFGWNFSKLFNVPTIKKFSKTEIQKFAGFFAMFVGATWAKDVAFDMNLSDKKFDINFDKYVVCNQNGLGHMMAEGALAGGWAWIMQDYTIEGVQTRCQGRGDKRCVIICAPRNYLEKNKIKFYKCDDLTELEYSQRYLSYNKIRPTNYAKTSVKELITQGFFKYKESVISYNNQRYFPVGAEFIFFLERELAKLNGGLNILFDISSEAGAAAIKADKHKSEAFLTDFISALGWGDVKKIGAGVGTNIAPWTELVDDIDFTIFRGLASGILTECSGKNTNLKKIKKTIMPDSLSLLALPK